MPEREFFYVDGRFFARLVADVPTSPVGVWELREITRDMLPDGVRPVAILAADAERPSDTGEPWQARAIRAEMEAAQLRTRVGTAEGKAERAANQARAMTRTAQQNAETADRERIEAERRRVQDLREVAEKLATVYDRTAEFEALTGPESGGYGSWCDMHDELFGDHDHDWIGPDDLRRFIEETLALDHPAVRFPQPGPATIANACVLARTELAKHGGTLDDVAEAILRMAAEPQRPEDLSHRAAAG